MNQPATLLKMALVLAVLFGTHVRCSDAQEARLGLLLKVDQTSSGPFGGQAGTLCLRIYSNGRVVNSESRSAVAVADKEGKTTRSEKTVTFEYQVPEIDRWRIQELEEFVTSKSVTHLPDTFGPPHPVIDFVETSTVQITLPKGKSKTIKVREYYAASLVERAKYPAALVILMERLAKIEDEATEKGKAVESPSDCHVQPQ